MKTLLFFLLLIFHCNYYVAQGNTMMVGAKSYPCSDKVYFGKTPKDINFYVLRDLNKGIIVFEDWARISGTALLYLEDNTSITLIDRGKYDYYNDTYYSIFYLTESEVKKLNEYNISSIRITRKIYPDGSIGEAEVFSGTTVTSKYNPVLNKVEETVYTDNTKEVFNELFDYKIAITQLTFNGSLVSSKSENQNWSPLEKYSVSFTFVFEEEVTYIITNDGREYTSIHTNKYEGDSETTITLYSYDKNTSNCTITLHLKSYSLSEIELAYSDYSWKYYGKFLEE